MFPQIDGSDKMNIKNNVNFATKSDILNSNATFFTLFSSLKEEASLPEKFTFPFYYEPHELAILAAEELQKHIQTQKDWTHDFGLDNPDGERAIGKMFGVLVVKNQTGQLGYLSAFSGKLAESNHWPKFVPPVFDILKQDGFYKKEEQEVNELNRLVDEAEKNPKLHLSKENLHKTRTEYKAEITSLQAEIREKRKKRKALRQAEKSNLSADDYARLLNDLSQESIREQYFLKDRNREWQTKLAEAENQYVSLFTELEQLKTKRGNRSAALQKKIFAHYTFLNAQNESKSLMEIFSFLESGFPPAGSGECAAPKLLHYAYQHQLEPICMAEFWWGKDSNSEIRKHKHFYPACRNKCEPILGHMLQGLEVEDNPILKDLSYTKEIDILFEDEAIIVVHKPHEFLSVPGKIFTDSVQTRIEKMFPNDKPILVHRLDMSTSGLLLIAKSKEIHKKLQSLFIKRTIKKRYVAILDGVLHQTAGVVDLPLRLDIDNRPHQMVCEEFGKKSRTEFKVISTENNQTRIHFFPITGRTHQLRVHASHPLGLNIPILGDDLYGKKTDRLYLHAEWLKFKHPITQEEIEFEVKAGF